MKVHVNSQELPYTAEDDAVLVDSGEWTGESCVESAAEDGGVCEGEWIWRRRRLRIG